jgi:competence protein ComEA
MKNTPVSILACACLILAAFLFGLYLGRNISGTEIQTSVLTPQTTPSSVSSSQSTSSSATQTDGKININTADLYTLMALPGIGETYAQRIIDYRNANGPFQDISDIKNVDGIGEKRYESIKNLITTGG